MKGVECTYESALKSLALMAQSTIWCWRSSCEACITSKFRCRCSKLLTCAGTLCLRHSARMGVLYLDLHHQRLSQVVLAHIFNCLCWVDWSIESGEFSPTPGSVYKQSSLSKCVNSNVAAAEPDYSHRAVFFELLTALLHTRT